MDLRKMTDQELIQLTADLKNEKQRRKIEKMSDNELFKIAKAKNGEYSDEEALSALNAILNRPKPNLEIISQIKMLSHSEQVRDKCADFLFK